MIPKGAPSFASSLAAQAFEIPVAHQTAAAHVCHIHAYPLAVAVLRTMFIGDQSRLMSPQWTGPQWTGRTFMRRNSPLIWFMDILVSGRIVSASMIRTLLCFSIAARYGAVA